ncbi:MAG TPA: hypothetical protein K8W02_09700 [Mediterranea massiliensis]|uniref:Uncharacterized protein n=1 Tax=Mediterranea massiliensis TaxID=1841865 RepID=A0A921HXJ8_9BACT|nr:hypothetical protein [Mediterranea massiliensis]CCZ49197.1 uncharacterized protein BN750_01059 [Bacteroides sp. CAG:661]HJF92640.1 hypothetical protein [Mediterranea massiliensis]
MTKDYSGKQFSRKMNKSLLIVNIILLVCAVWLLVANIRYEEYTTAVAMGLVAIVALANGTLAFLRLKGKKI